MGKYFTAVFEGPLGRCDKRAAPVESEALITVKAKERTPCGVHATISNVSACWAEWEECGTATNDDDECANARVHLAFCTLTPV